MDSASARCTDQLDLVLFIPQTPEILVLVHDVILLCALEPSGNVGIQLSKQICPSCGLYMTLFLRKEKRGTKRFWLEPGWRGDNPSFLPGWAAILGAQGRGLKGSNQSLLTAPSSSTPSTQPSELLFLDINSQHWFHFSLLPRAEVRQIGAFTFSLCHRFVWFFFFFDSFLRSPCKTGCREDTDA